MSEEQKKSKWDYCLEIIKSDPKLFGGDYGNTPLMRKIYMDFAGNETPSNEVIQFAQSILRTKNKVLLAHPELDFRVRFAPKSRKKEMETKPNLLDFMQVA